MKKITLFAVLFAFVATQYACKDDDDIVPASTTTEVALNFNAKYGADDLVLNSTYDYEGSGVKFSNLNFYISNVVLVKASDTDQTEILEIALIDFTTADGNKVVARNVPTGTYSGLKINIGVPSDLNRLPPTDFATTHPLGNDSQYWSAWDSYIFAKIEGAMDTLNAQIYDHGFLYHSGTDAANKEISINRNLELTADATGVLEFDFDLKALFNMNGTPLNIKDNPIVHDPNNLTITLNLMNNFNNALSLQ